MFFTFFSLNFFNEFRLFGIIICDRIISYSYFHKFRILSYLFGVAISFKVRPFNIQYLSLHLWQHWSHYYINSHWPWWGGSAGRSIIPLSKRLWGLISGQGTYLGCRFNACSGAYGRKPINVTLSLPLSLKSVDMSLGED